MNLIYNTLHNGSHKYKTIKKGKYTLIEKLKKGVHIWAKDSSKFKTLNEKQLRWLTAVVHISSR